MSARKKSAFGTVCIVLVLVFVIGALGWFTNGFRSWNPKEWFDKEETPTESPIAGGVIDENGNEMESGKVYPMSRAMTFRNAVSLADTYNSVIINAVVKPENAKNKLVDWTVSFVNPLTLWAKDKVAENYVSVTPQSDGSTTANVQCLQPFGEKIKVTVTSRENTDKNAECVLDFVQRIIDVHFGIIASGNGVEDKLFRVSASEKKFVAKGFWVVANVQIAPVFSDYTLEDSFIKRYTHTGTAELLEKLKEGGLTNAALEPSYLVPSGAILLHFNQFVFKGIGPVGMYSPSYYCLTEDEVSAALEIACQNLSIPVSCITANFEGEYSSASFTIGICSSVEGLGFGVESIELDSPNIVF